MCKASSRSVPALGPPTEFVAPAQKLSFTGKVSFSLKKICVVHKFFFFSKKYFNGWVIWTSVFDSVVLVLGILIRGYFMNQNVNIKKNPRNKKRQKQC